MPSFNALILLIAVPGGLIIGLIAHFAAQHRRERRAWGAQRSTLSRADRRRIRHALRHGQQVGDRSLAAPAVLYGTEVESSIARAPSLLSDPPRGVYVFGRIFFPLLGTAALVLGITGHDPVTVVSGIVLVAFTALYLPVSVRWTSARRAERDRLLHDSLDANRLLSAGPGRS